MVQADADGGTIFLAFFQEPGELASGLLVVLMEVPRIDPDLLHHGSDGNRRLGGKMDVCDERNSATGRPEAVLDLPDVRDILQTGDGDPNQLRSGGRQAQALVDGRIDIIRMGIAHRLDDDRVASSDEDITHLDDSGFHHGCCSRSSATTSRASLRRAARVWPRRGVSW